MSAMLTAMPPLGALLPLVIGGPAATQDPAQGDWTIYRGDPGLSGIAACELPAELELFWSYDCGEPVVSSPVVRGGRVYVGADDGKLHAIDFESGAAVWSFATEDMIEAPPLVRGELVYVGSTDGHLYAVDAESGEERWRFRGEDKFVGSANWLAPEGELPGRVVAGCYDNRLYCLDAESGEKLWSYETDNYINGTPAVTGGRVVFGGCDAVLHVVDGRTGEAAARVDLGAECYVAGSTAAVDGRAYLGHYGNAFVCFDLASGEEVWRLEDERHAFFSAPAVGAERVVFGGRNKQVHCVDRATGELLWRFPTRRKVDGSPVIAGDKVIVGSGDGRLYLLDLKSGEELWSYEVGRSISSSPAVTAGRVVVGADDGQIYCFGTLADAIGPEAGGSKR
jgi:outer membrane protein assembly factor BamB